MHLRACQLPAIFLTSPPLLQHFLSVSITIVAMAARLILYDDGRAAIEKESALALSAPLSRHLRPPSLSVAQFYDIDGTARAISEKDAKFVRL